MKKEYLLKGELGGIIKDIYFNFHADIHKDKELRFYHFYIPQIKSGEKICTIRFKPNAIRVPASFNLPCFATDPENKDYCEKVGIARLNKLLVSDVADFPEDVAKLDGFESKEEMLEEIGKIYKCQLKKEDYLSAYFIEELELE